MWLLRADQARFTCETGEPGIDANRCTFFNVESLVCGVDSFNQRPAFSPAFQSSVPRIIVSCTPYLADTVFGRRRGVTYHAASLVLESNAILIVRWTAPAKTSDGQRTNTAGDRSDNRRRIRHAPRGDHFPSWQKRPHEPGIRSDPIRSQLRFGIEMVGAGLRVRRAALLTLLAPAVPSPLG